MAGRTTETGLVRRTIAFGDYERAARAVISGKRSKHTRAAYEADLAVWVAYCSNAGIDPIAPQINDVAEFRDGLKGSAETARRRLASLSSIYSMLLRGRAVQRNPFHPAVVPWPPASSLPKTRLVTDEHAQKMIDHAIAEQSSRGRRDAAIIQLLYDTGLRRVSVASIRRITYVDGTVHATVKGDKEVELVLPDSSVAAIDRWLEHCQADATYLFPGLRGHLNPATINKIVKHRAGAVGARHVHPHSFRAAFVTAGYDAGIPEHEVQASVHHSDPKTTRRYDRRVRGRAVATAVEVFRKRGGKK